MLGAVLVWFWLVVGLRLLSGGGAWQLGWGGAIGVGTLLWPLFAAGYFSLKRLGFGSTDEQDDEITSTVWEATLGLPALALGFLGSLMVLGMVRFLGSFGSLPRGGVLNFFMSVLALHLLAWVAAGASHWAWSAWRERDE